MIDFDTQGSKRLDIVRLVKERYGEDSFLNYGTFTTEGTRSTILTACRSIGLSPDEGQNIAQLAPNDKGKPWPLHDAFYGNESKGRKASLQFIKAVEEHDGLKDLMLGFEGLVSGRGQHASGASLFTGGFVKYNAMMKTTSGLPITQFDAGDSEFAGAIKYDFLSIVSLDQIRSAMDSLLDRGKIQWQGSLRETYNKYFHPDVLELEAPEMYKLLFDNEIPDAFQFSTKVGRETIERLKAETFDEVAAANSLMRLTSDGEQPVDKFIRYKNDPLEWEKDMDKYGLTKDERKIIHDLMDSRYGVCDTQELLMQLAMHEKTANFNLREGKALRKACAKQDPKKQSEQKEIFFRKGKELGTRENLLNYIWNECFVPTFGYAFSLPHIVSYSLILMQEMNIAYRYLPIYWKVACLSVNAGLIGDLEKGTDYSTLAKALSTYKSELLPPSINKSELNFTVNDDETKINYGLKPITGLNRDLVELIEANRPYTSFKDFLVRVSGDIQKGKMISMIKAGLFDEFNPDRKQVMYAYISYLNPIKEKQTTVSLNKIYDLVPKEWKKLTNLFMFDKAIQGKKNALDKYNLNLEEIFIEKYASEFKAHCEGLKKPVDPYSFDNKGNMVINTKEFSKWTTKKIKPLKEWLNTPEALLLEKKYRINEMWQDKCQGSVEKWEFESLSVYLNRHEIENMPLDKYFEISNYFELPEDPIVISERKGKNGRVWATYKSEIIAGTVVEKKKDKGLITIVTKEGAVDVRVGKGRMSYYMKVVSEGEGKNRKTIDKSWFDRGTNLIIVGYRRGSEFVANKNGSSFSHAILKIEGYNDQEVFFRDQKYK